MGSSGLGWLTAVAAVSLAFANAGCVAETDDCRCAPGGPHSFALDDGPPMRGLLQIGDVGPGDRVNFTFSALGSGSSVQGRYAYRGAELVRDVSTDGWASYTPATDFDWLDASRGDFVTSPGLADRSYIRRFEYHRNADASVDYRFTAVDESRIDFVARTIDAGTDEVLTVTARLTATCLSLVDGVSQLDPTFANNPLCRDLLAGSP